MKNPLWFILWLIILIIAFPIAFFCAGWYILLYPLTVCVPAISGLTDLLHQGVQLTHYAAKSMVECKPLCSLVNFLTTKVYTYKILSDPFEPGVHGQFFSDPFLKRVTGIIENVWLQIKTYVSSRLLASNAVMDDLTEQSFKSQILLLANKDSSIRSLMWKRLITYFRMVTGNMNTLQICTAFKRVVLYNFSAFNDFYLEVWNKNAQISMAVQPPAARAAPTAAVAVD